MQTLSQKPVYSTAADMRRQAMVCAARAETEKCSEERVRLLKMRDALVVLADNEDWLAGIRNSFSGHVLCEGPQMPERGTADDARKATAQACASAAFLQRQAALKPRNPSRA